MFFPFCTDHLDGEEKVSVVASFYRAGGTTAAHLNDPVVLPTVYLRQKTLCGNVL